MIAFFEDGPYFATLADLFARHHMDARGWPNYEDLEKNLRETQPKVVLLDIRIGNQVDAGLQALEKIKDQFPRIKTIVLTGYPDYVLRAFRLGADGYLLKEEVPDSLEYIQEMVREVIIGKVVMSDAVKTIVVESLRPFEKVNLNTRELQILHLSASDKNVPQIADLLGLTKQTVETYFKNIRGKLDCHTIQGAVAKAIRHKILENDLPPS